MAPASFRNYIDWDNDGTFNGTQEDVTSRTLDGRAPIQTQVGRDRNRSMSPTAVGRMTYAMNNRDRVLSPENAASPIAANLLPARSALLQGTFGATLSSLFVGHTVDVIVQSAQEDRYVEVSCDDTLGRMSGVTVSTPLYRGITSGQALHYILDAMFWPRALRDIDAGASVFPFWWLDQEDAFQAMLDVVTSEGPPAMLAVDSAARIVFRDRHHRLRLAASTTSQATWRSGGAIEPTYSNFSYDHGFRDIVNSVSFQCPQRRLSTQTTPVWQASGQIDVAAGDRVAITARGSSAFTGAVTPVQDFDYTVLAGSPVITMSRDSGASATIYIETGAAAVSIADLQLRAYAVESSADILITAQDPSSIAAYLPRSLPDDSAPKWCSAGDAQAIATLILAYRAERIPTVDVTFRADQLVGSPRITQQLTRALSDRVTVVDSHTGLNADVFIERIAHTVTQGGREFATTFGCEKAAAQITGALVLGSATSGVLGTNRLGKRGFPQPATMFVLGSGTNGLLGTNVLSP